MYITPLQDMRIEVEDDASSFSKMFKFIIPNPNDPDYDMVTIEPITDFKNMGFIKFNPILREFTLQGMKEHGQYYINLRLLDVDFAYTDT